MDALYSSSPVQFRQLVTHIALAHEECTPSMRALAEACLRDIGVRHTHTYAFWHVPQLHTYMQRPVPVDVHGRHVLVDEAAAMTAAGSYGVLRFALLAAAQRARGGGRWRYDYTCMNVALGAGAVTGAVSLAWGRRHVAFMRRRPVGGVLASLACCLVTVLAVRAAMRGVGVGMWHAQRGHRQAMSALRCVDCLDDVVAYNRQQLEVLHTRAAELLAAAAPASSTTTASSSSNDESSNSSSSSSSSKPPSMLANAAAPLPPDYAQRVQKSVAQQELLLELDAKEAHAAARRCGGDVLCPVHRGLREAPVTFAEPHGLPLLPSDRERAAQRQARAAEAAATRRDDTTTKQ